jgi:hypothetical protein
MVPVLLARAACLVVAMVVVRGVGRLRGTADTAAIAARHGLQYSYADPFGCTRVAFALFRKGDGRAVENVVWRDRADGLATRGFDLSYFVERTDEMGLVHRRFTRFSCVMAQLDGAWPDLSITREGIVEKALDLVGLGDIELESDDFNRRFALRSPDRRFAVTLVDARMIDFLLSVDGRLGFFVKGRWLLLVSAPVSPALVPGLMGVAEAFVTNIPRVVYELWPSPFRDAEGRALAAGDDGFGQALARAEAAEADPWGAARASPREAGADPGPEYDLDGNLVEPRAEDPWRDRT